MKIRFQEQENIPLNDKLKKYKLELDSNSKLSTNSMMFYNQNHNAGN